MAERIEIGTPIIAAVRSDVQLQKALVSPVEIVFLLESDITNIKDRIFKIKKAEKLAFVHADFVGGLSCDSYGVKFLSDCLCDGIISTRAGSLRQAKNIGLKVVQRFFVVDSLSVISLQESVKAIKPDMIEVMPGILGEIIKSICQKTQVPVIAGGLVTAKSEVLAALSYGAVAVSTGKEELWYA